MPMIVYNTKGVAQYMVQYQVPGDNSPTTSQLISTEASSLQIVATESGLYLETE